MSDHTSIEWTDTTWNPTTGCTQISPGCDHCYAKRIVERFHGAGSFDTVQLHDDRLDTPYRWRKPRRVFVNSMSDLFHNDVPDSFIAEVFAVMARTPQHTYQILTKRHGRMRALLSRPSFRDNLAAHGQPWPLPNVWLGVSVEDQRWADIRIPALLGTPAAVRFLSCEPLLGPIDLSEYLPAPCPTCQGDGVVELVAGAGTDYCDRPDCDGGFIRGIHWVIAGGESGPGARPMHPDWPREIRDRCTDNQVPFFFKQWGGCNAAGERHSKRANGRELDGRTWDQYPATREAVTTR